MSKPPQKPATPESALDPTEMMLMRLGRMERRLEHLEQTLPQQVMQILSMFFTAAAQNRNQPQTFGFDFYQPDTDSVGDTLRIVVSPEGMSFFAYAGPDQWVDAHWIQPESLLWNKAAAFMQEHTLLDAHVKLVTLVQTPEPDVNDQH